MQTPYHYGTAYDGPGYIPPPGRYVAPFSEKGEHVMQIYNEKDGSVTHPLQQTYDYDEANQKRKEQMTKGYPNYQYRDDFVDDWTGSKFVHNWQCYNKPDCEKD